MFPALASRLLNACYLLNACRSLMHPPTASHGLRAKGKTLLKKCLLHHNSREQLFLFGDGRSGTTWLAELLNYNNRHLTFFEPYHGRLGLKVSGDRIYPTPADFSGNLQHLANLKNIATPERGYGGLEKIKGLPTSGCIVKDVSCHMILPQLKAPRRRWLYLLRHPFSVALSKQQYGDWHRPKDIDCLIQHLPDEQQRTIAQSILAEHPARSRFSEFVFVWSLLHLNASRHLDTVSAITVHYEDLLLAPQQTLQSLFAMLGREPEFQSQQSRVLAAGKRPSKTTGRSGLTHENGQPQTPWEGKIPSGDLANSEAILSAFGIDHIYRRDALSPATNQSALFHSSSA